MAKESFTWQAAPAGSDSQNLEEYLVAERETGDTVGKVVTTIVHEERPYVVVDRSDSPLGREYRAIPLDDVDLDHVDLVVHVGAGALDAALELDPDKRVESPDADARRVGALPAKDVPTTVPAGSRRVRDTGVLPLAVATGIVATFALLVVAALLTSGDSSWYWALLVVPAALAAVSGALLWRAWRRPWDRAGAR